MQNDRFDAIPIPGELSSVVKAGIQEGIREQKRHRKNRLMLRYSAAAAATLVVICAGVLLVSDPSLADRLPLIGRIFATVQEKVSYKGNFSDNAEVYVEESNLEDAQGDTQNGNETGVSEEGAAGASGEKADSPYRQTSNGLTVTVSEANCTEQALYLALCIENEEEFPSDFIKTKNMDGYALDYDSLYLKTESYYDVPGMGKEERQNAEAMRISTPYYIEGNFVDSHTFTGIIRVSLEDDLMCSGRITNRDTAQNDAELIIVDRVESLPEQFTYYLEISDIYGELLEYDMVQVRDPETNETVDLPEAITKHYEGTWNFAIDVKMNRDGTQTVQVNKTNENGVGIAYVEKTDFEIRAQILLPEGAESYDYIVAILDADGRRLDSQGQDAEVFSTYGRNTDTVYVYVCDYVQFMDELKGDSKKIEEGALFGTEVHF